MQDRAMLQRKLIGLMQHLYCVNLNNRVESLVTAIAAVLRELVSRRTDKMPMVLRWKRARKP